MTATMRERLGALRAVGEPPPTVDPEVDDAVRRLVATPGTTILDVFAVRAERGGDRPALRARAGGGQWRSRSWSEYGESVREVATGLQSLGVRPGDRVGILSGNRPDWHVADLATMWIGGVSVPVYPTSAGTQLAYVLAHSGARACFVEAGEQLDKLLDRRAELPDLAHVVVIGGGDRLDDPTVIDLAGLQSLGRDHADRAERHRSTIDDLATLVYTSGTTGPPKGTMITHGNILATIRSVTAVVDLLAEDRFLSFLPLSHITERSVSHFGQIVAGGETWFARSISTVADDLRDCRPTVFFGVPRVWEKFREAIVDALEDQPRAARVLARRYLDLGPARVQELQTGEYMPFVDKVQWLALDAGVGRRLRHRLGLDHARLLVSGAAAIHPELLGFFHGIGLPVAEGYGQTEVCLATSLNPPDAIRIGTVGRPLPGIEVRISEDGEILVRGQNVCRGYYRDDEATAALLDPDGWLHTGDLGRIDDGYLRITGRVKDLIVTAYGKNIAPQVLETELAADPMVGHAVVVGEGRPFLTALVTLDGEHVARWALEHGRPAEVEALAADPDVEALVGEAVARVNRSHAPAEQIRRWRILPEELTIAEAELTPTLKVRRATVIERNADVIDALYATS